MEVEVLQTVLTEVLEELKEMKQQDARLIEVVTGLNSKLDEFELKLSNIKASTAATNLEPITLAVNQGLFKIGGMLQNQSKSVTRQYRILLFPEHNAREYYRIVFGRLLFWMMFFLLVTYLFSLSKRFVDGDNLAKYKEAESAQYRRAWNYLYRNSKKTMRVKMDTVLMRDFSK